MDVVELMRDPDLRGDTLPWYGWTSKGLHKLVTSPPPPRQDRVCNREDTVRTTTRDPWVLEWSQRV